MNNPNSTSLGGFLITCIATAVIGMFSFFFVFDWSNVEQGEGLVFVKKPIFMSDGGVEKEVYLTGKHFHVETTTGVIVQLTPQQKTLTFTDLATDDKVPVDFVVTVQYKLRTADGWKLVNSYVSLDNWFNTVFSHKFSERVRNYSRGQTSENMMYSDETLKTMGSQLLSAAREHIAKDPNSTIDMISVIIGKANPPEPLANEINETARQRQRKKTETQKKLAESERALSEKARANADAAYQNEMKMTTAEYLHSRQLDIQQGGLDNQKLAIEKGKNVQFIISSGGNVQPVKSL
jgi:hypothetical protein